MKLPFLDFGKTERKLSALHIDDSKYIRIPVSVLLRRHFAMRVLEAANGPEGLRLAELEKPDLILLDVLMPQMDGFSTLAKLKENERTQDIPVIMCTARDLTREVNMALRLGAIGYLLKPLEEESLIAKVREILISIGKLENPSGVPVFQSKVAPAPEESVLPADRMKRVAHISPLHPEPKRTSPFCPFCQQTLNFVTQYSAWYCYPCRKYPDFELV